MEIEQEQRKNTAGLNDEQNIETDEQITENDEQNIETDEQNKENPNNEDLNKELYGAPESYDFQSIELPEGVQYNEEYGNKFSAVARELNLSQNSANKLVNLYVDILKSQTADVPEALKKIRGNQIIEDVVEWDKQLNQDTEIGNGNKDKINQYIDKANVGYEAFASEELKNLFKERGLTHNPEVIKLFYKLSDLAVEDKVLTGGDINREPTPAEILYGKK